jgi:hypothetical protein
VLRCVSEPTATAALFAYRRNQSRASSRLRLQRPRRTLGWLGDYPIACWRKRPRQGHAAHHELAGTPFGSQEDQLLTFGVSPTDFGRKSGKRYVQPVSYVPDGNTLLTPGGGRWKLNLKPSECVRLRLRGGPVLARPELIRDVSEVERLLRRMQSVNLRITGFVPVGGSRGEIDRARLQTAINYGFALIRWHFDCPPRAV